MSLFVFAKLILPDRRSSMACLFQSDQEDSSEFVLLIAVSCPKFTNSEMEEVM